MNLEALYKHIKSLDLSVPAATSDAELDYFRFYGLNLEEQFDHLQHYFGTISSGRYEIACHYFQNPHAQKTCFIVHGYYDHAGLYQHVARNAVEQGYSVVLFDLPGHGLSTGEQASILNFEDYLQSLRDVIRSFDAHSPKPFHVVGQSTGAAIVMDYMLTESIPAFEKQVLLAPLVWPVKWRQSMWHFPITKRLLKTLPRHFAESSTDEAFLDFIRNHDPLQAKHLCLRWVDSLKRWVKMFTSLPANEQCCPLVIQGKQDETVDWRRNMPVIQQQFPQAKFVYLQTARHHLVNESEELREKLFAAINLYSQ
jgi:alpha-beta hydrolase superfamily lysophospholipase